MNSIYIRLVDSKPNVITTDGILDGNVFQVQDTLETKTNQLIKVDSYSSDIEQTLNIGSQSTGVGAGKITFNPFSITKAADAISPLLFQYAATGTPFKTVDVFFVNAQNFVLVRHTYKMVAVKTISWSAESDEEGLKETVTFEYGGLIVTINQQSTDGKISKVLQNGWNRLKNIKDVDVVGPLLQ